MPTLKHTPPPSKVITAQENNETPVHNTSLRADGATANSPSFIVAKVQKRLSLDSKLTPTVNIQQGEGQIVEERVKSPLRVETQDNFRQCLEEEPERDDEISLEEDRESLIQFRDNVEKVQSVPFNKLVMEETEEDLFTQEVEDRELETEVEKTNKMLQNLR